MNHLPSDATLITRNTYHGKERPEECRCNKELIYEFYIAGQTEADGELIEIVRCEACEAMCFLAPNS